MTRRRFGFGGPAPEQGYQHYRQHGPCGPSHKIPPIPAPVRYQGLHQLDASRERQRHQQRYPEPRSSVQVEQQRESEKDPEMDHLVELVR